MSAEAVQAAALVCVGLVVGGVVADGCVVVEEGLVELGE